MFAMSHQLASLFQCKNADPAGQLITGQCPGRRGLRGRQTHSVHDARARDGHCVTEAFGIETARADSSATDAYNEKAQSRGTTVLCGGIHAHVTPTRAGRAEGSRQGCSKVG